MRISKICIAALIVAACGGVFAGEDDKYVNAVRTFADNVLTYGKDTYGPKHTPLFIDGINLRTHEPAKWKKDGQEWILSKYFHCPYDGKGRTYDNSAIYSQKLPQTMNGGGNISILEGQTDE
jgi:hypothetical protein